MVQDTNALNIRANYGMILSGTCEVNIYTYIPALDGTETFKRIDGTTNIANGVMSGGSGYLTSYLIDNSKDWEISMDGKFSGNGCGITLVKNGTKSRSENRLMIVNNASTAEKITRFLLASGSISKSTSLSIRYPEYNTYANIIFKKQGDIYTVILDNTYSLSITESSFKEQTPLCVGLETWGTIASIKNIKIKYL